MSKNLIIRPPADVNEVRHIETLQRKVWGAGEDPVPYHIIMAIIHAQGVVLGAFDGDNMVGFCLSFQGKINNKVVMWSHMTAVLPSYRSQRVGQQIKLAQRLATLEKGIDVIAWTYDPMRKSNAIFNLCILGGTVHRMHKELYGEMPDELNRGLVSDRFELWWDLNSTRANACADGGRLPYLEPETYTLRPDASFKPQQLSFDGEPELVGIELPGELDILRENSPELTHSWYYALREAIGPLFEAQYRLEGIALPSPDTFAYVLRRGPIWYLYVLETTVGSYYTGITTDLERRVKEHNSGTGSRYTRSRRPVQLVAAWRTFGRSEATGCERSFKALPRQRKERLVNEKGKAYRGMSRVV